jgi:hypothetical protein
MDISKVGKKLNKLNSLFNTVIEDGIISEIERDLLLSYTQRLYEAMLEEDNEEEVVKKKAPKKPKKVIVERVTKPEKIRVVEVEKISKPEVPKAKAEEVPEVELPKEEPISAEVKELFNIKIGSDVSEKLSLSSIKQLTKAFSINERIFTIKELFDGKTELFNETLTILDGLGSYDEATKHLQNNIVKQLDWTSKDKLKKAQNFILLVYRRFS